MSYFGDLSLLYAQIFTVITLCYEEDMKQTLPELKSYAMWQGVYEAMRTALMKGHFRPGEALPEVELASQLKVSRGPVREALLVLVQEGLVSHSHNYGFVVVELNPGDHALIQKVRIPLEAMALDEARSHTGESELRDLKVLRDELLETFRSQNALDSIKQDQAFHTRIWELSENRWLLRALKSIMAPYFSFAMVYKMNDPELTYELMKRQHDMYLDYLRGLIADSAEDCVRFHVGSAPLGATGSSVDIPLGAETENPSRLR